MPRTVPVAILTASLLTLSEGSAATRGDWFKSLLRPGTIISCCDVSDCRRTEAEWKGGVWWAIVFGQWLSIPPDAVLQTPRSLDGDAYVCAGEEETKDARRLGVRIYCFVPPDLNS